MEHNRKIGILITNLGTPDAPTAPALRKYLREFLSDRRVVDNVPPWKWWLILNGIVLVTRPRRSAKLYKKIWTSDGSPLLLTTRSLVKKVEENLKRKVKEEIRVAVGMRYGNPGIREGLQSLLAGERCGRLIVLPLYPQYCSATTASTLDALGLAFRSLKHIPEYRFVFRYAGYPGYIDAVAESIRSLWDRDNPPDKILFSYHGVPKSFLAHGDPYYDECRDTSEKTAKVLGLESNEWDMTFQSRFGPEEWLQPYTDKTLEKLAREGVKSVDVVCPGFSADCLETLEEIDGENRKIFLDAGGKKFRYIPCLNASDAHAELLTQVILDNIK